MSAARARFRYGRSCASGISCSEVRPEVVEPARTPSIKNKVVRLGATHEQRRQLAQPALVDEGDAGPAAQQFWQERALLASICARSITSTAASAASTVAGVRVAVTMTLSRSLAASAANTMPGKDKASTRVQLKGDKRSRVLRDCMWVSPACQSARHGEGDGCNTGGSPDGRCSKQQARRRAMPAASQPTHFKAGLRACKRRDPCDGPARHLPMPTSNRCAHSGMLPNFAYRCGGSAGLVAPACSVTGFPLNQRTGPANHLEAQAL